MGISCKLRFSFRCVILSFCILIPILLLPLAFSEDQATRCSYVLLFMVVYWMLEPVHLAVTALLPVVLMPLLDILPSDAVCANYMKEVLMMFVGGLAVAVAVEHCHLHERIALRVLLLLGSSSKWLMLGFMLPTMFLSMWISNTATTAMMVPIIDAVMTELKKGLGKAEDEEDSDKESKMLHKTLLLSVAYAANCGGTGTLPGTSPNMIFKGLHEELYPDSTKVTYATWMMYNIPGMLLCVLAGWILLQVLYVPCWKTGDSEVRERVRNVIENRYKQLGSITFHEIGVLVLFIILVLLWVFRDPKFMPGWTSFFHTNKKIGNAVPVIAILFLLFLIPAEPRKWPNSPGLLNWHVVQTKVPWGVVLLLGGGFALAEGTQKSGLSDWFREWMTPLSDLPPGAVLVILCVLTAALTEVISNSTVATIFLPVVAKMATIFNVNPLYFMLAVTVASSYAFMLPVATAPNAIVFECGQMTTFDMVKPGLLMNIAACLIQIGMINSLGVAIFNLNEFPSWANQTYLQHNNSIPSS